MRGDGGTLRLSVAPPPSIPARQEDGLSGVRGRVCEYRPMAEQLTTGAAHWRRVRRLLNERRQELAAMAARLYPDLR
jgi:hypothetical protein